VSVAAVVGDSGRPGGWASLAGCVHSPGSDETWTAGVGEGAHLNGARLVAGDPPELDQALVATGFSYLPDRRARQARILATLLPLVRDVRRIGSSAMEVCMVATGRLDAYFEHGLHAWDLAASRLVASEAGVTVRGIGGHPPEEHVTVVARRPLVDDLAARLERLETAEPDGADGAVSGRVAPGGGPG
jgi:myo-inositol-1(or 4)-monophosphatase